MARNSGYSNSEAARREAEEQRKREEEERKRQEEAARRERERQRQLSEARAQKNGYEAQKSEHENQRAINEDKIERLKAARTSMENIKAQLTSRKDTLKTFAESADTYGDWYGDKVVEVQGILTTDIPAEYNSYIDHVDDILDAICNEITRLQNENYELDGIIGQLCSWINSLLNKIRTLGN